MKTSLLSILASLALTAGAALHAPTAAGQPLGTNFTYQGQLKFAGAPLNNTADFEFKLFNAATGGVQQGSTNQVNNINIVNGLFTVSLDFGINPYNGDRRWLQIAARSPAGGGNFTTLTPRQPLTATPFALYALTGPGSGGPWAVNGNNVFNTNTGNVGIGTNAPQTKLHVQGVEEGLRIQGPSAGAANRAWIGFNDLNGTRIGYVGDGGGADDAVYLVSDAGSVHLATAVGAALTATSTGNVGIGTATPASRLSVAGEIDVSGSRLHVDSGTGNVGIGTTAPQARLDVRGDIRLGPSGQLRATSSTENLRIVCGHVDANGTVLGGSGGFGVSHIGTGQYLITFSPPFLDLPTVTGMTENGVTETDFSTWSAGQLQIYTAEDNGIGANKEFNFIAVGLR